MANYNSNLYIAVAGCFMEKNENELMSQHFSQNEQLFLELLEEISDGIILWDESGHAVKANPSACRILECTQPEILEYNYKKLLAIKRTSSNSNASEQFGEQDNEINIKIPNGKEKILDYTCRKTQSGFKITIFRDVTIRHILEKELKNSERKFQRIFENAPDGILLWNDQYQIIDLNSSAETIFGYSKEQLIGKYIQYLFTHQSDSKKEILKHLDSAIRIGQYTSEIAYQGRDGSIKQIELSSQHGLIEELNLTLFRDITEKKVMQEKLRKSDTLNVIGELAAGIAHEIRNPMTALKGFIQLLKESLSEGHSMYFQVITSELERIDSIINEFLVLAKPHNIQYQKKDINQIVQETIDLLTAQAALHNIQFQVNYHQLPPVYCEPNQLKKVFINLVKNAIEVMPSGGTITISTEMAGHQHIHISIQDEGWGIPEHKLKKLGEPFYTTKERGTGLGLMVSFKIIEEHHGNVRIESAEGQGTSFHLYFPIDFQDR